MKTLITAVLAVALLGGCVAVPYYAEPAPAGYYYGPAYPAASVQLSYGYYRGPRHDHAHYR